MQALAAVAADAREVLGVCNKDCQASLGQLTRVISAVAVTSAHPQQQSTGAGAEESLLSPTGSPGPARRTLARQSSAVGAIIELDRKESRRVEELLSSTMTPGQAKRASEILETWATRRRYLEYKLITKKIVRVQAAVRRWLAMRRFARLLHDYVKSPHAQGMRMRNNYIRELVRTEQSYVDGLGVLIEHYMYPMMEQGLLPDEAKDDIFSNVEIIYNFNARLLEQLTAALSTWPRVLLGAIFLKMAPFLRVYKVYINNYDTALSSLAQLKKKRSVKSFLADRIQAPETQQQALSSYLITPIQRIPRYLMLVNDILKHTLPDHIDYEGLAKARDLLQEICIDVNEGKREVENQDKVVAIQESFADLHDSESFVAPHRRFVREGPLTCEPEVGSGQSTPASTYAFLFNDLLVTSRIRRDRTHVHCAHVYLANVSIEVPGSGSSRNHTEFRLQRIDNQTYLVCTATSPHEKEAWFDAIQTQIAQLREKLRTRGIDDVHRLLDHGQALRKQCRDMDKALSKAQVELEQTQERHDKLQESINKDSRRMSRSKSFLGGAGPFSKFSRFMSEQPTLGGSGRSDGLKDRMDELDVVAAEIAALEKDIKDKEQAAAQLRLENAEVDRVIKDVYGIDNAAKRK